MIRMVALCALLPLAAPRAVAQYSFTDLGPMFPNGANLVGLSPDGSTILGSAPKFFPEYEPTYFRDGKMIFLPIGDHGNGVARAAAPDGAIVGGLAFGDNETISNAAVWRDGELTLLERVFDGGIADGHAISSDGRVVVGSAGLPSFKVQPARWVDGEIKPLGDIPGSDSNGTALAVSADGSVIVGRAAGNTRAFRWMNGAMGALPLIDPDEVQTSLALDVSADGRRIVGVQNDFTFLSDALLWEDGVPRNLGYLPGANKGWANSISADGGLVFGNSGVGFTFRAFVWDDRNGMRDLTDLLLDAGVDMQGWSRLEFVRDVSADGRTILGYGYNAEGEYTPFLATIPEPSTLALTGVGLALLARRRR